MEWQYEKDEKGDYQFSRKPIQEKFLFSKESFHTKIIV